MATGSYIQSSCFSWLNSYRTFQVIILYNRSSVFHLVNWFHQWFLLFTAHQITSKSLPSWTCSWTFQPVFLSLPFLHTMLLPFLHHRAHLFISAFAHVLPLTGSPPLVPLSPCNSKFKSEHSWSLGKRLLFCFVLSGHSVFTSFMASTIVNVVLWAGVYFTYLLYDPDLEGRVFVLMIFFSLHNPAQGFGWSMGFIHICC